MGIRNFSWRDFLRYSFLGAAGLTLAACVAPAAQQAGAGAASSGSAQGVTLRYTYVADPGELEVRQACIADFMTKYPTIKIDGELVPEDGMGEKILTQLAGGAAPDMVYFNQLPLPLYASQNVFVPVNDYAERDSAEFQPDDFFTGPLGVLSISGKVYGYPYYSGPWMIIYNKDIFDAKGVPTPDTYTKGYENDSDEWTWEKLAEVAEQVTSGDGADRIWGYYPPRSFQVAIGTWLAGYGVKPWTDDLKTATINTPESIEAHQFQIDMFLKSKVAPDQATFDGLPDNFKSGKLAMYRMLRAAAPGYKDITFNLGEVVQPKGPKGRFTVDGPNAVGIVSSCQHKDEAWTFSKYLPGYKPNELGGQEFEFKASRSVPTRKSNFGSSVFKDNLQKWEDAAVYQASASKVVYPPTQPGRFPEIENAWQEHWDAMRLGQPVKDALDELNGIIQGMLAG